MQGILYALALLALVYVARRYLSPACPRCRSRNWDRKLCQPLLFCRACATRVDAHGRTYN